MVAQVHEVVEVQLADLLLDTRNARLGDEQPSQQATYLAMARQQGRRLTKLAEHIVEKGLDPTALIAVVPSDDQRKRYRVVEGNRRVLALKALETPSIVSGGLSAAELRKLTGLSKRYAANPVDPVTCVLFDNEEEVDVWVFLRHTGANDGAGLVGWDANEQDRYRARHTGRRSIGGQVLDFVEKHGTLSPEAAASNARIITTVQRVVETAAVRPALGIDIVDGRVVAHYPIDDVAKGLSRVVDDLKTQKINVRRLLTAPERGEYVAGFDPDELPDPKERLKDGPVALDDYTSGAAKPAKVRSGKKGRQRASRKPTLRTSLIPRGCTANPTPPRINAIYNELHQLNVELYPNACAVLLRVFVELSTDHEIDRLSIMTEQERMNSKFSKRLKSLADRLRQDGRINEQLRRAMVKIADSGTDIIAASAKTMNQYVHNPYVHPKASELRLSWDEWQPFFEAIWP